MVDVPGATLLVLLIWEALMKALPAGERVGRELGVINEQVFLGDVH